MGNNLFQVGQYVSKFNADTGQQLPCGPIYQSAGLAVHIQKHQPQNGPSLLQQIPAIISAPDYIGKNPNEPNSIELVKNLGQHIMACIKLDSKGGYLYVASAYTISPAKLNNRLNSGRLKRY